MKFKAFLLVFAQVALLSIVFHRAWAQTPARVSIQGEVAGKSTGEDSILLHRAEIDAKYFENSFAAAKIENGKFLLKTELPYPKMYMTVFASDRGMLVWRHGRYFIDQTTTVMRVDTMMNECGYVNGQTSEEFRTRYIPFMHKAEAFNCKEASLDALIMDKATAYDTLLYEYVSKYPDSYVALWGLIERFSLFGHSNLRAKTLLRFSDKIKKEKPWLLLENDLRAIGIKENGKFPQFPVQTEQLTNQRLVLPKAKYTLVDFWFSRCKPCLDAFPTLKRLYSTYHPKGFEIISVSTDRTKDLSLWPKRIQEYGLPWAQYLDENAVESIKLLIRSFPSTFLLNERGEIVKRDLTLPELEAFLEANLKSSK
ncbi:TlpA family protein disulfide reductase [Rufibacter immobilis]|uniref:TlpA family protein disulfide reductase n=1 Tax=Rufibacter immobilis TaxID=1348778 RepID=A0A3M9MXN7_9BACT|nr:TlpA disulfide reductase family protein [Rufibacter immobilis]RNI29915.1 TlpA family protein disulfide reductase [Rufibacter immobilis]